MRKDGTMNKYEDLETGCNFICKATGMPNIAYCEDIGTWRSILTGYKILLSSCLTELLTSGLLRENADKVSMLNLFMNTLDDGLTKGGDDE